MGKRMKIQRSDLVKIYQLLMDALSQSDIFHNEIVFAYDYYWNVTIGERCDVYNAPKLDIGSIEYDLERVHQCIQNNAPMLNELRYLGNILIAIADTIEHRVQQGESNGLYMTGDDFPPCSTSG